MADIVIRNGHVIDPANQVNLVCDVAFKDGRISAIGTNLPKAREEVDASGCLVVPGLIDLHAHVYEHATTLGVNPDETCLARGNDNNRINFTSFFHWYINRSHHSGWRRKLRSNDISRTQEIYHWEEPNQSFGILAHCLSWTSWSRMFRTRLGYENISLISQIFGEMTFFRKRRRERPLECHQKRPVR